jgi:Coenzyme PQQ synthesis protein D (PqqD)
MSGAGPTTASVPKRPLQARTRVFKGKVLASVDDTVIELTESGGCIWRWIDGSRTIAEISELLSGEYAIDPGEALTDVVQFVTSLNDMGIISY